MYMIWIGHYNQDEDLGAARSHHLLQYNFNHFSLLPKNILASTMRMSVVAVMFTTLSLSTVLPRILWRLMYTGILESNVSISRLGGSKLSGLTPFIVTNKNRPTINILILLLTLYPLYCVFEIKSDKWEPGELCYLRAGRQLNEFLSSLIITLECGSWP